MKHTHPLFAGNPGKWDGIPEPVVRSATAFSGRVLSQYAEASLAANQPIQRDDLIARMVEAKRAMDALPPVQSEMKMHPDDIEALRRQCGEAKTTGPVSSWAGIKIIPDESAERLPRKAT